MVIDLLPDKGIGFLGLGDSMKGLGNYPEALENYTIAIEDDDTIELMGRFKRARLLYQLKDYDLAL
jgi:tetratricopeptide (TPR) repeat protein